MQRPLTHKLGQAPAHSQKMDASFPHPAEYARNNPPPSPTPEYMRHARAEAPAQAPAPMPAPRPLQQTTPFVSAADHAEFLAQAMAILNMPGKLSLKKAALRALLDETP